MEKIVNNLQNDYVKVETNQFNFWKRVVTPIFYLTKWKLTAYLANDQFLGQGKRRLHYF